MNASSQRPTVSSLIIPLLALGVSVEFLFARTGGLTLSEAIVYGTCLIALARGHIRLDSSLTVFLLCLAISVVAVSAYGFDRVYGPYLKTLINHGAAAIALSAVFNRTEAVVVGLKWLLSFGLLLSSYGIAQGALGLGVLPDIYSSGGVPGNGSTASDYELIAVMQWKIGQINSGLGLNLVGLGYGFHWFSNNYGEYLVYVAISAWILVPLQKRPFVSVGVQGLILAAIIVSGARTAFLGYIIVSSLFIFRAARSYPQLRFIFGIIVISGALLFASDLIRSVLFDHGGTITGRSEINFAALAYIAESWQSLLFGGNASAYLDNSASTVHATFLYYWLFGGIFTAVLVFFVYGRWLLTAGARYLKSAEDIHLAAVAANLWFLAYGLTWAVVTAPNTIFLVSFFNIASLVSSRGRAGAMRETMQVKIDPAVPPEDQRAGGGDFAHVNLR